MEITTNTIKELRDKTGVSVMQCKKALEEAGGDLAKAEVILQKRSAASAQVKADRSLGAGTIGSYVHDDAVGAMVLLSCETDFVAKNPDFAALARDLAMQVAATDPRYRSAEDIPEDVREAALAVFRKEAADKPVAMQEKIIEGKLESYFRDQVLLEQSFIKDETKTVRDLLHEATQRFGERVELVQIARLSAR
jgi:elongation factor Ts